MKNSNSSSALIIEDTIKSFYIKALVEHNANEDYGLPKPGINFAVGDILYVKNGNNHKWWLAVKLDFSLANPESSGEVGLIPSAQKLCKSLNLKSCNVEFQKNVTVIESNGYKTTNNIQSEYMAPSVEMKRRRQEAYKEGFMKNQAELENKYELSDVYQIVQLKPYPQKRPVFIFGPGRNMMYDSLIADHPDEFASPVNHTTRPMRLNEVDGVDYHFIESEEFEKEKAAGAFVESVRFRNNWYGTSELSIRTVMDSRSHCILDATYTVITALRNLGIEPIAILIHPSSMEVACAIHRKGRTESEVSEKAVRNLMQQVSTLYSRDRHLFNVVLSQNTFADVYKGVYNAITNFQNMGVWEVATDQSLLISEP